MAVIASCGPGRTRPNGLSAWDFLPLRLRRPQRFVGGARLRLASRLRSRRCSYTFPRQGLGRSSPEPGVQGLHRLDGYTSAFPSELNDQSMATVPPGTGRMYARAENPPMCRRAGPGVGRSVLARAARFSSFRVPSSPHSKGTTHECQHQAYRAIGSFIAIGVVWLCSLDAPSPSKKMATVRRNLARSDILRQSAPIALGTKSPRSEASDARPARLNFGKRSVCDHQRSDSANSSTSGAGTRVRGTTRRRSGSRSRPLPCGEGRSP